MGNLSIIPIQRSGANSLVLVLVLSETVLVLDGCSDCGDAVFSFGKVYL